MKVYRMNEIDSVLHHSFEEAVNHYDGITGVFDECKDDDTGKVYSIGEYKVFVNEPGDEPHQMTVQKALEQGEIECPTIFSSEQ